MNLKNKIKIFTLVLLLAEILLSQTNIAFADQVEVRQYTGGEQSIRELLCAPTQTNGNTPENANSNDLYNCINKLYRVAIVVASIGGMIMIIAAGYVYMSAGGNQESVNKAKSMISSTIAALVILFVGYLLLKLINPNIVTFQPIQPESVRVATSTGSSTLNPNNSAVADLQGSGCTFQTDTQKNEAPQMAAALVTIVKTICYNIVKQNNGANYSGTQGHPPTISSVIGLGQHAENSYHYKGCAVDFADGGGNGFFSLSTKQGRATGVAIYQEALKAGISSDRINPGTDATRTDMIHIDLGSSCPN